MNKLMFIPLIGAFTASCFADVQKVEDPLANPPASCSAVSYLSLLTETGTDSFHLLRFEIRGLAIAHEATESSLKFTSKVGTGHEDGLTQMLIAFSAGREGFSCAAYVMGKVNAKNENDTSVRSTVMSVYNTFSSIEDEFRDRLVRKIQKKEGTDPNALGKLCTGMQFS